MEHRDLLREGLQQEVERFVDDMGETAPEELTSLDRKKLIYNITDLAIGRLRKFTGECIESSAYSLLTMIRHARLNKEEKNEQTRT